MRVATCLLALLIVPAMASAQDAPPPADAEAPAQAQTEAEAAADTEAEAAGAATEAEATAEPDAPTPPASRPKIAVIVVGDPDPVLQAAALEIDTRVSLDPTLRVPTDASLRAALRGEAGAPEDGLDEVRRERRRLGLGEASDAPVLARLGRRAGAVLVLAVREGAEGPEALALDARAAQFFDGTLALTAATPEQMLAFVTRRARVAARGSEPAVASDDEPGPAPTEAPPEATQTPPAEQDQPDWFAQNWPYFAAGALLAAALVFVIVTATDGSGDAPPMLRFQPPGAP